MAWASLLACISPCIWAQGCLALRWAVGCSRLPLGCDLPAHHCRCFLHPARSASSVLPDNCQRPCHPDLTAAAPLPEWRLWGPHGEFNWALATFIVLASACVAVWGMILAQCAACRR